MNLKELVAVAACLVVIAQTASVGNLEKVSHSVSMIMCVCVCVCIFFLASPYQEDRSLEGDVISWPLPSNELIRKIS